LRNKKARKKVTNGENQSSIPETISVRNTNLYFSKIIRSGGSVDYHHVLIKDATMRGAKGLKPLPFPNQS